MNLQFQHTFFFWLLGGTVFFILLFLRLVFWKKRIIRKIGDVKLVKELMKGYSPALFFVKFILVTLAFVAGVISIANLRRPVAAENVSRKGIDLVIALDVSKSMLANDLEPSRLERARQMMLKLIDKMPDDRIGLVIFAGRAYLQMPLTTDHAAAKIFMASAGPDAVPAQGTVIADALQMGSRAFNSKEGRFKSMVLISDGEDHDPNALKKADELAASGIMINTVGIGSAEGSTINDPETGELKKDASGNPVISKLNDTELKMIAQKTNGIYVHLQSSDETVSAVLNQLSQIERKAFGDVSLMNYQTYYWMFAIAMFVLLLVEFILPERKRKIA